LIADGTALTRKVEVLTDPRAKTSSEDLQARQTFAMQLRSDISKLTEIVMALRDTRQQLQERVRLWAELPKAKAAAQEADKLIHKLDALESQLHNPKAEVTYDILAMKGGAKLYSQLAPLYAAANDSDGPVTQGMREVYASLAKELRADEKEWDSCLEVLSRINDLATQAAIPNIVAPKREKRADEKGKKAAS
jgi:hypothetical protein